MPTFDYKRIFTEYHMALENAQREYEAESARLRTQTYELPKPSAEKRSLIQKLIESLRRAGFFYFT